MRCQNCGHDNEIDATFCEKCGSRLDTYSNYGRQPLDVEKTGMKTSTKLLIIGVIALVAVLGIAVGAFMQMNKQSSVNNAPVSINQSSDTQQTSQSSWHEVTTITNPTEGIVSFNIKGEQCKIVISATPIVNYQMNILSVDLLKNNVAVGTDYISWTATESPNTKENTPVSSAGPGNYQVNIHVTDLETWKIKVYDYY
jgi:hypothetical protein